MATIKIKRSSTAGQVGPDANAGEISANLADKQFYIGTGGDGVITFKDATQVTQEISTAINGLSSAFEYKGTLAANGDAYGSGTATTTAASLPASPEVGDYYKVDTAGYFTDGTNTFFVNIGDAVVHNSASTGQSWDVLDNTNSTVSGTANVVDVSGSTETGYTVNINSNFLNSSSTHVVDGGSY